MAQKKYTLYFKGQNKYGHEHNLPIVSLDLKSMDEYTSNYKDYYDLFNCLPNEITDFIKQNLLYKSSNSLKEDLNDNFFITDNDFTPIMDVIFENDLDVLYISPDELYDILVKEKMNYTEFQSTFFKTKISNKIKKKYEFFKYLYITYVKNQKISCMIDVYDVNSIFPNLNNDELMIAAIATDKVNLKVLCKKLSQNLESRRNLTYKFKTLFNELNGKNEIIDEGSIKERKNKDLLIDKMHEDMLFNLSKFKKGYEKEYKEI